MYRVIPTNRFKKNLRQMARRGYNLELIKEVIIKLKDGEELEAKHRDHALSGNYSDYRECHIQTDWLLIYRVQGNIMTLTLTRTGTHSDLFR